MVRKKKEEIAEESGKIEEAEEILEVVEGESEVKKKKGRKKKEEVAETAENTELEIKKAKTSDRTVLLRELKEKAKKLAEKIKGVDTESIKEELAQKRETLVPLEDYVKTGIHLGTRVITPDMKRFVYRRRADSIGVLNTALIDEHIKKAIEFMIKYNPEEIILVCKRESGWKSAALFSEATGIKIFTKKYPAGMMTNIKLETFAEPELIIVCDPWIDRNAMNDAIQTNKKKIVMCDTNNFTKDADVIIPCNNKGGKSLGLIFYLLAKGYIEKKKLDNQLPSMETFIEEDLQAGY
jgi:small subunit ribosomal protein S2